MIGAAQANDVLPASAFGPGAGGDHTEPGTVVRFDDIGLIGVELVGDHGSGHNIARVRRLSQHGRGEESEKGKKTRGSHGFKSQEMVLPS